MDVQRENKIYLSYTVFLKYFIKLRFYKVLQYWRRCDCKIRFYSITSTSTTLALVNYGISNTGVLEIPEFTTKTDNYSLTPKMPHVKIPIFTSPPHGIEAPPLTNTGCRLQQNVKRARFCWREIDTLCRVQRSRRGPAVLKPKGGDARLSNCKGEFIIL